MRNKLHLFIVLVWLFQVLSCKKEAQPAKQIQQNNSLEAGLINFSINGELMTAVIDTAHNTITITIPDSLNQHHLIANFTLASQVSAAINNIPATNGAPYDFNKPVNFTLTSADKKRSTTFTVIVQTDLQYFGLTGNVIAARSLNKDYSFYFDQFDGSTFQSINCGPTVTTMAIKWADSSFTKKPVDARHLLEPQGGWWFTSDVQEYLQTNGINYTTDTLRNLDSLVKQSIDHSNLLILCLDMFYVSQDIIDYQHIQKFYMANNTGWGHFLLVKGYKQSDDHTFYLEIYDPFSDGAVYRGIDNNQLKGKDRYYLSGSIKLATDNWWPYAIVIAQKGTQFAPSGNLTVNSIRKPKTIPIARGQ